MTVCAQSRDGRVLAMWRGPYKASHDVGMVVR
jgi:hypothetical protein